MGTVSDITLDGGGCTLTISDAAPILGDCHVGDSIAVNGACLTVTRFDAQQKGGWFEVWLANETLERTDLGMRCEETIDRNRLAHDYQESGRSASWSTWSARWAPTSGSEGISCRLVDAFGVSAWRSRLTRGTGSR